MRRLVFVDASEFISANYHFGSKRFSALLQRVKQGVVTIGMPSITAREIQANIARQVKETHQKFIKGQQDLRLLRNLDGPLTESLFAEPNAAQWEASIKRKFEQFLQDACAVELDPARVDAAHVFDLYFEGSPPFAHKKSEFPDAFALGAVSSWGQQEGETVLVASSDSDVETGCVSFPSLEFIGTLEQLLQHITLDFAPYLASQAQSQFDRVVEQLRDTVEETFNGLGFILEDQEGDVNGVNVQNVELMPQLLIVSEEGDGRCEAVFAVSAQVDFEVDVSYSDLNTGWYDREDNKYYNVETIEELLVRSEIVDVTVTLWFDLAAPAKIDFEIDWNTSRDISIMVTEADE